ncbi:MAG TPA: hypothetical protein VG917_05475 [Patescibacteria group bacterium]|nr:hypothetical protein [Patescibacteria group bacterium]
MQNNKYNQLFTLIRTTRDRNSFLNSLEKLSAEIFKEGKKQDIVADVYVDDINEFLTSEKLDKEDKNAVEKALSDIREEMENLKSINITLASYPNEEIINAMSSWLDKNMDEKVILNIDVDGRIGAGAVFNNGIFKDYSLNTQIEEAFKNKKSEILALIKN